MGINRELKDRPLKILRKEDITPENIEKINNYIDENIRELDKRRISQQTEVSAGASDSETITNLVTAVNALITALNNSSLTEN